MRMVLTGVVAAVMLLAAPLDGRAQGTATASVQPVRWEYLRVIEELGRMALLDGKTEVTLESLGNQGWEFVTFDNQFGRKTLIFKRPKL